MLYGVRPADAGASDLWTCPARESAQLLLQPHGNHQRVGAAAAAPAAETALVAG